MAGRWVEEVVKGASRPGMTGLGFGARWVVCGRTALTKKRKVSRHKKEEVFLL